MPVPCRLCLRDRELRKSHIIPKAWFRTILRNGGGTGIRIDNSETGPVARSQDSWWDCLLCAECEQSISTFEKYSIERLRGFPKDHSVTHADGITLRNFDYSRFKLFTTSLLWRAAISQHPAFQNVVLSTSAIEEARRSLLNIKALGTLRFGCRVGRLYDPSETFNEIALTEIVVAPDVEKEFLSDKITFTLVAGGYVFEYELPKLSLRQRDQPGVIRPTSILLVPRRSIFEIRSVVNVMSAGIRKADSGLVSLKQRNS